MTLRPVVRPHHRSAAVTNRGNRVARFADVRGDKRSMRLLFDHGTLILVEPPDLRSEAIPGLLWDPRVGLWRATAFRYTEVLAALRRRRFPIKDEVPPADRPRPEPFRPIELRPYQQAAALAWEQAGQRGVIVLPTGSGKTRVATAVLAASGVRAMCLVPTRALLQQ